MLDIACFDSKLQLARNMNERKQAKEQTKRGHCLFSLYRLFIASKRMSSQRTIFLLVKDKLLNLKPTVYFVLPRGLPTFQKFEGK